jgi:tetratricopeptide (TPR) repeat protein
MVALSRRWPVLVLALLVLGGALAGGCARSPEAKKARYLERGDKYFQKAQYKEALIEYANALRIEPSNARAIQQIGLAHYALGEWLQSFPFLLKTQQLAPDNQDVRLKVGSIYLRGRHLEEAEAAARTVLGKDPRNLEALGLLASAADAPEEIDAAIQQVEAARGDHGKTSRYHVLLASLYLRKRDAENGYKPHVVR